MLGKRLALLCACVFSVCLLWVTGCGGSSSPISIVITASSMTVDGADTITLTATVTNDQNSKGVTFTETGGGSFSSTTSTSAIFTAPAATSSAQTVTITATSVADATKSNSITVTVPAKPTVATTSNNLAGAVGAAYSVTLQVTGGVSPYTWAITSGTLPSCLTLNASTGAITGTPNAACAGTYNLTFTVTDSGSPTKLTGTASLTMIITTPTLTFTPALPAGTVGAAYAGSVAASGVVGATTYSIVSGALPPDLSLNTSTGAITGTPKTADVGTATFSVKVVDAYGDTVTSGTLSITVAAAPAITFSGAPAATGTVGVNYSSSVSATGGAGALSYALASGALPPDLTLSANGAIAGTPKAVDVGTATFAVKASDAYGDSAVSGAYTITVSYPTLTVTSGPTLASGTAGTAYSQQLATSGGTGTGMTWSVTSGQTQLTAVGLSLSSGGVLSGASAVAGTASFGVQVTDSASNTATATLSVTIYNAVTISTTTLPGVNVGTSYSQTLTAGGGTGTGYTWTATSSNLATYGLSLSTGGVVSGTPTQAGTATFTANVKDSGNNTATQALTIAIYSALSLPTPNPSSLPAGYTGVSYTGSINASGGSGNYCWKVTGLPSDALNGPLANAPCGYIAGSLPISGTPTSATTVSFNVTLTDTSTNASVGQTYTINVSNPTPVTLPTPNPGSLPAATVSQSYSGSINASGGGPPYTWSVNGTTVTAGGVSLSNGLTASSSGSSTLSISGTPTSTGTVTLTNVKVTDSLSTNATNTYSITVNNAGSTVSGQIGLDNYCGNPGTLPTFSVQISGTGFNQSTTTDSNGNYSFTSVPNGTYTLTPSITGPSSIFYPATYANVAVNNANISGENFSVTLGYTVSGTVSYSGSKTGQVYVSLINNNCSSESVGTSISAPGAFTIRGAIPGSYTLQAWKDTLGQGSPNTADPSGSAAVAVTTANVTGQSVTMTDPTLSTPTNWPNTKAISPISGGAVISFGKGSVTNNNGQEVFTQYTVQWSTTTAGFSSSQQATFKAVGTGSNVWVLSNGISGISGSLTNGTAYYFRVMGSNPGGSGPWAYWGGSGTQCTTTSCAVTVTIGAPTGGNTVSGSVTLPSTITPTGPLYVGYYDSSKNQAYATEILTPSNSSPNAFTVNVPSGSNYVFFGILDQNNDGSIDVGDITNVHGNNTTLAVSGNLTNQSLDLTAYGASSKASIQTQYQQFTTSGGTSSSYYLTLGVNAGVKLPVAVTLTSGPNLLNPIDLTSCQSCGSGVEFQYSVNIGNGTPKLTDSYVFTVTYGDGTQDTSVTGTPTAFGSTGVVTGPGDLATSLSPSGTSSSSTTPTFTWTDPSGASNYYYGFYLTDNNNNTLWQIPQQNSNQNGFSSSITSITWGTDPTGNTGNTPTVPSLTLNSSYSWTIIVQDTNGNQTQTTTWYQP